MGSHVSGGEGRWTAREVGEKPAEHDGTVVNVDGRPLAVGLQLRLEVKLVFAFVAGVPPLHEIEPDPFRELFHQDVFARVGRLVLQQLVEVVLQRAVHGLDLLHVVANTLVRVVHHFDLFFRFEIFPAHDHQELFQTTVDGVHVVHPQFRIPNPINKTKQDKTVRWLG